VVEEDVRRTALVTFELEQLTAVSERFAGAAISDRPFGNPGPRPGSWGPRYSLEGRSSAPDGTRATLTLDLTTEDGSRLRLFARFDDAELRDASRTLIMGTSPQALDLTRLAQADEQVGAMGQGDRSEAPGPDDARPEPDPGHVLRFPTDGPLPL